jgi:hypothetical protein
MGFFMNKIINGIKNYFLDWRNWITHSLVGILLLAIAIFAPVSIYLKIVFIICVVGFNVLRMKYFSK